MPTSAFPPGHAKLRPRVYAVLRHALAREEAGSLAAHFATMLEDMPIGLMLLDLDLRTIWYNGEAANACAVWNHGERKAAALNPRRNFRVPAALTEACARLKAQWEQSLERNQAFTSRPVIVSDHAHGLHAQIVLRAMGDEAQHRPAFGIQLDYRRPRGDRNRPLSPGAVAALGRLSAREREVVMGVREGLPTRQIAAEQRRSPLTIKTQLSAIYAKLGVRGRTQVAALLNR
ncbi:MAG: response regulator transcription factor [Verrucomicrobiota bacterium]